MFFYAMTLSNDQLLKKVEIALQPHKDHNYLKSIEMYVTEIKSKSSFKYLGVRTPNVRKIANELLKYIKSRNINDIDTILKYCEVLLSQGIVEYRTIAFQWSFKYKKQFELKHFTIFERWVKTYITGWGSVDDLCTKSLGYFVYKYTKIIPTIKGEWTQSTNKWVRRASAVAFIYSLRRGKYLEHIFEVADKLLEDPEMYVLKGYGWMLKEASNLYQKDIYQYVLKNKSAMPRVSLRYAIEKMPEAMRKKAMEK